MNICWILCANVEEVDGIARHNWANTLWCNSWEIKSYQNILLQSKYQIHYILVYTNVLLPRLNWGHLALSRVTVSLTVPKSLRIYHYVSSITGNFIFRIVYPAKKIFQNDRDHQCSQTSLHLFLLIEITTVNCMKYLQTFDAYSSKCIVSNMHKNEMADNKDLSIVLWVDLSFTYLRTSSQIIKKN